MSLEPTFSYIPRRKGVRYQAWPVLNSQRRGLTVQEMRLPANDFRMLCAPGVYIFWQGRKALYVGFSRRVLNRISNPRHGAIGMAMKECTDVEIVICASEVVARDLEIALIAELLPQFNVRGKPLGA